jgi:hypothetical protein
VTVHNRRDADAPVISRTLPTSRSTQWPHYTPFHWPYCPHFFYPASPPSDRVIPTLSLVHWHTQHPSRLRLPPLQMTEHASSIVCRRNVALDVTRMPPMPLDTFQKFNVLALVLDTLHRSAVHCVLLSDGLAPLQAVFTTTRADDASGRRKRYLSRPSFVRAPKRRSRGEALPAAVPNPPALAAGHPCDFDIRSRGYKDLVSGVPPAERALRQMRTPHARSHRI